ncbi:MAG: hypothetical protein CMP53_03805 [Flavobacteriales bacterium]|nr:hypothetical protein [Flavobacteriales bacterium]|tara:strand:+ start:181 stop:1074 length:894 start_codon:yes stop_codon:yes gene_type:complete
MIKKLLLLSLFYTSGVAFAQEKDLFDLFEDKETSQVIYATFKGTHLINAATNETPGKGVLQYVIAHRFGSFGDEYLYNFFGLDNAQIRMQVDYGINDRLNIGVGRSSFLKVADGFIKYQLLQQQTGDMNIPLSISLHSSVNYRNAKYTDGIEHFSSDRLSYMHQAIIARKWNRQLSTLISPSIVHFNLVPTGNDPNTTAHLTLGGRYKLSNRMALTAESTLRSNSTYGQPNSDEQVNLKVPLAIGVDIETGGHVFQFHLSNTQSMNAPYWMAQNPYDIRNGSLFLGFNISRVFTIRE